MHRRFKYKKSKHKHHHKPNKKQVINSLKIMKHYMKKRSHHLYDRHLMDLAKYHSNDLSSVDSNTIAQGPQMNGNLIV